MGSGTKFRVPDGDDEGGLRDMHAEVLAGKGFRKALEVEIREFDRGGEGEGTDMVEWEESEVRVGGAKRRMPRYKLLMDSLCSSHN
jgi:hypothetical protein